MTKQITSPDSAIQESTLEQLLTPVWYQVVLLNDDFTPMDFVVDILVLIFKVDSVKAQELMLKIHHEGRAVCGVFPSDIAESKIEQVEVLAESREYPLQCLLEKV